MGVCCVTRDKMVDHELDLDPPAIEGNHYQKFELSLPFACTWVDAFERRVRKVEKDNGVTLDDLRTTFTTNAWKSIKEPDSKICKLLEHPVFANDDGTIDANALVCFALLHCAGTPTDKAAVLYGVLQEGGVNKNPWISAADKDFEPIMNKMFYLVSFDLAKLMKDIEGVEPMDLQEKP